MKYLVRSIKYFIYICCLLAIALGLLMLLKVIPASISDSFRDGWKSIVEIAGMFALVAAVYPKVGFVRKDVAAEQPCGSLASAIRAELQERGYVLVGDRGAEDGTRVQTYRMEGLMSRIPRYFADEVTVEITDGLVSVEGLRKDIVRIVTGLERRIG